jgi:hypothetical protein
MPLESENAAYKNEVEGLRNMYNGAQDQVKILDGLNRELEMKLEGRSKKQVLHIHGPVEIRLHEE